MWLPWPNWCCSTRRTRGRWCTSWSGCAADLKSLPGSSGSSRPERLVDEIATRLRRIDPADLEEVTPDGVRAELDELLDAMHRDLRELSGVITATHLSAARRHAAAVGTRRAPGGAVTAFPDGPTASGSSRCYQVTHRTVYQYSDVVTSSYGRGFLTPRDSARQRCLSHELVIEPEAADSSTSRDGYGNISSYFHVTERHHTLSITSTRWSRWIRRPPDLYSGGSARAPWEIARPVGPDGALATEFTLDLRTPEITDELREYAAPSFEPGAAADRRAARPDVADPRRLHLPVRFDDGLHSGE